MFFESIQRDQQEQDRKAGTCLEQRDRAGRGRAVAGEVLRLGLGRVGWRGCVSFQL